MVSAVFRWYGHLGSSMERRVNLQVRYITSQFFMLHFVVQVLMRHFSLLVWLQLKYNNRSALSGTVFCADEQFGV